MHPIVTALLLSLASAPGGLHAQSGPPWRIESGHRVARVAESTARGCCKVCSKGKACGNSCIARNKECHKGRGCAWDG